MVLASGVAYAASRQLEANHQKDGTQQFTARVKLLLHCFYVLSGVLVTSTLTALLFFHLPVTALSAIPGTNGLSADAASFASALGTFWGAIYSLTLFAVFVGPAAKIYVHVRTVLVGDEHGKSVADWLREHGLALSLAEGIKNVLVLVAPLLVGPVGDLVGLLAR